MLTYVICDCPLSSIIYTATFMKDTASDPTEKWYSSMHQLVTSTTCPQISQLFLISHYLKVIPKMNNWKSEFVWVCFFVCLFGRYLRRKGVQKQNKKEGRKLTWFRFGLQNWYFINASTCDINYMPTNTPIVFDISLPKGHSKDE